MHDTLPPILSVWSGPAAPLCCLANKSQARLCSESLQSALEANLNGPGSMIYQTVWKPHTTPLGRQIYRLRASARRTSDSEHSLVPSGWPTPAANKHTKNSKDPQKLKEKGVQTALADATWLSGWPTPITQDAKHSGMARSGPGQAMKLVYEAQLSGWPTPNAGPQNDTDTKWEARRARIKAEKKNGNGFGMTLGMASTLSGWPTPTTRDHKDGKECPNVPLNALLGRVAWLTANPQAARITADGTMLTGCSAGVESGGQLNPAFSGWLMGFPEAWCRAAISCQLPTRLRKAPKKPGA